MTDHLKYTPHPTPWCPNGDPYCGLNGQCGRCKKDHADWSSDLLGVIGDSADKRFTFIRTDGKRRGKPEFFHIIDWEQSKFMLAYPEVLRMNRNLGGRPW